MTYEVKEMKVVEDYEVKEMRVVDDKRGEGDEGS